MLVRLSVVFYATSNDELFGNCARAREKSVSLSMGCTGTQFRLPQLSLSSTWFTLGAFSGFA